MEASEISHFINTTHSGCHIRHLSVYLKHSAVGIVFLMVKVNAISPASWPQLPQTSFIFCPTFLIFMVLRLERVTFHHSQWMIFSFFWSATTVTVFFYLFYFFSLIWGVIIRTEETANSQSLSGNIMLHSYIQVILKFLSSHCCKIPYSSCTWWLLVAHVWGWGLYLLVMILRYSSALWAAAAWASFTPPPVP